MRILFASDLHVNQGHLFCLLNTAVEERAEVVIIGGDIAPRHNNIGNQADYICCEFLPELIKYKSEHPDVKIFLDMANDDLMMNRPLLEEHNGNLFYLIHNCIVPISNNLDLIGYMNVPVTPFHLKDWELLDCREFLYQSNVKVNLEGYSTAGGEKRDIVIDDSTGYIEDDLEVFSRNIKKEFILVTHSPPYNTKLDVIYAGFHVGSMAVRRFIEKHGRDGYLRLSLHGHIHESPEVSGSYKDIINGVECINPGQKKSELQTVIIDIFEKEKEVRKVDKINYVSSLFHD